MSEKFGSAKNLYRTVMVVYEDWSQKAYLFSALPFLAGKLWVNDAIRKKLAKIAPICTSHWLNFGAYYGPYDPR